MIYLLVQYLEEAIDNSAVLGPLGVFRWVEFRAILSIVLSFLIVVLFAKRTIRWLVKQKIGDNPSFDHKELDQLMKQKANTPTMGGILIAFAIFVSTILLANLDSFYVIMALVCLIYLFLVGFVDDWLKLTTARRKPGSRHGFYSGEKLLLQLGLAVILGLFIHHWGNNSVLFPDPYDQKMSHSLTLPLLKTWVFENGSYVPSPYLIVLGTWQFVLLTIFIITYSSNAVNLTDGMDGLAAGNMVIVAFAFVVLCIIAGYTSTDGEFVLAKKLLVPHIPFSDELAIVAGAMVGSCLGFLWFNCSPAQVFMGDSGSLPLGGLLGYIAVVIRQEFLLMVIGGVFLMEVLSVMLQVGYFKLSGGKRIFKCAPIHHHFHLSGWTEQQVVVRFWLISALLTAIALATIKLR